jgi:aminomuconate-semialdehyde/2-hydroxymuconate-6-semialdehyde dehydrogenase
MSLSPHPCVPPSGELTPRTANALAEVMAEVGLPVGVFNVVHGFGGEAGAAMVGHKDARCISFTGGTSTGKLVAATAAPLFKKLSLELGGKNSTIVFDDADLEKAVSGAARSAFTNNGQVCLAGSRIFVQDGIYDAFVEAFSARIRALRVGDPLHETTDVGPVSSQMHREKVESYFVLAKEEGGSVIVGGGRPSFAAAAAAAAAGVGAGAGVGAADSGVASVSQTPSDAGALLSSRLSGGAFVFPTVIVGLPSSARTATEEIFGPVCTIHRFHTEAEAVAAANEVAYGLAGSVWTSDLGRAHRVAHAVEAGILWVNCWLLRDLRTPFGGVKDSGVGREGGRHSLEFYSEFKNVCVFIGETP